MESSCHIMGILPDIICQYHNIQIDILGILESTLDMIKGTKVKHSLAAY